MKSETGILATRYGGIIPIVQEMVRRGLPDLIDNTISEHLPRKWNSKYSYSDMIISWICASLSGAIRIDQLTDRHPDLASIPELKIPSHDTVGRMMKMIASDIKIKSRNSNETSNDNYYDDNILLNKLLIQATKLMGILNEEEEYILDVDCTFIHTRVSGAMSMKDKDAPGFYPMVCLIGELPVFVSMRNGNSGADFRIKECVELCLNQLEEAGIKIKKVRSDGAGYRGGLVEMLQQRGIELLTTAPVNITYRYMFDTLDQQEWNKVTFETANSFRECEMAEIEYCMYEVPKPIRIIALRVPAEEKLQASLSDEELLLARENKKRMQDLKKRGKLKSSNRRYVSGDWKNIRDYHYKIIATTDFNTPAQELVYLYNQRGEAERQFSFMKNDFGWKYPPFTWMNENTVFFIITALANNVFRAIAKIFNQTMPEIDLKARIRKFQTLFINASAVCIDGKWSFFNAKVDLAKIA